MGDVQKTELASLERAEGLKPAATPGISEVAKLSAESRGRASTLGACCAAAYAAEPERQVAPSASAARSASRFPR